MLKIVELNGSNLGSTGKIMYGIAKASVKKGHKVNLFYPKAHSNRKDKEAFSCREFGTVPERRSSDFLCRIFGIQGMFNYVMTSSFIRKLDKLDPDIVQLHNLHGNYVNIGMLFRYLKKHKDIQVVWTLHDCWAFTGGCPHYIYIKCEKWMESCGKCRYRGYPMGAFDRTGKMLKLKKGWYGSMPNLFLVVPSKWLELQAKKGFLKELPIKTINNGVDLNLFKPVQNTLREELGMENKFVILGVSYAWNDRKGLDVFLNLAQNMNEEYKIILVGVSQDQHKLMPPNILAMERTDSAVALAGLYSMADVFLNPTREDTFPTVNLEALACGTPVLTPQSCGSPEAIDSTCGVVYEESKLIDTLKHIKEHNFSSDDCRKRAEQFEENKKYQEYAVLYESLVRHK